MAGVLIHDGRRPGHLKWSREAIQSNVADGVMLTPFASSRAKVPRHPSATQFASEIVGAGGEVIFDAMTHAAALPNTDKWDFYDGWHLWGDAGFGLETAAKRQSHVERVFERQDHLDAPNLAPTLQLQSPLSVEATHSLETARLARGLNTDAWQSLVGTRSFWSSGSRLDAYIGTLVSLRAPVWVLTVANELVVDHVPDLVDTAAFEGFCRTVHSLALRSRVVIAHADFGGLPAVAAGADTVGSGWDRGQRTFDPLNFKVNSDDSPRIPASYVTQGGLQSVLRRDTADAIQRWDPAQATTIRGGGLPPSDQAERTHHLRQLRDVVTLIDRAANRADRVKALRQRYSQAASHYDALIAGLPSVVRGRDKRAWVTNQQNALEAYAAAEGL